MRKRIARSLGLALIGLLLPALSHAGTYKIDPQHTSVTFSVRHLFTKVNGRFDKFEGTINFDPKNPSTAKAEGSIDVASINTNVEKRDTHLKSKDFFEVEKFPKITFVSTGVSDVNAESKTGKLHGKLKIHGVEKDVVLDVAFLGEGSDPWGNKKAGFSATTTINRKDFGLNWNETLETGGVLVGDEIQIEISAEGNVGE
jgi:polyisoprenoid-binding protein YceI